MFSPEVDSSDPALDRLAFVDRGHGSMGIARVDNQQAFGGGHDGVGVPYDGIPEERLYLVPGIQGRALCDSRSQP
jgi:hypothetical protein